VTQTDKGVPRHIRVAYDYGLIVPGYCLKDYIQEAAISKSGYEVGAVDGVQRVGKSNETLQMGGWAKEATLRVERGDRWLSPGWDNPEPVDEVRLWREVLKAVLFKASEFVSYLQAVPDGEPTDVVLWDDIAGHYSNMSFRIDPEEYAQVDGAFTVLGTKARVIITNIPNLTRLSKNVKDHISLEIFIGRNRKRKIMRVFRLPGLKHIDMNTFKADMEQPSDFDIYKIPAWAWNEYEAKRIRLAKEVFSRLGETVEMDKPPEGYISLPDAIKLARENGLSWGVSTITQTASRGGWKKIKAAGYMFIERDAFCKVMEAETSPAKGERP
jgi:hypothetical protein